MIDVNQDLGLKPSQRHEKGNSMFITLILPFLCLGERGDNVWKDRFTKEAPTAWEKYAARALRLQGEFTSTTTSVLDKKTVDVQRFSFKQRDGCRLDLQQYDGGKDVRGELHAYNPHYKFLLARGASTSPWKLAGVGSHVWKVASIDDPDTTVNYILATPYTFAAITAVLAVPLNDPAFTIDKVSAVDGEEGQWMKVEFRFSPGGPDAGRKILRRGSVMLDPQRYWVIRSFEAKAKVGELDVAYTASFRYADASGGFPILIQTMVNRKIPAKNREFECVTKYVLEERDVPESEFRLRAFGFPEPPGVPSPSSGSRWYLWFIAAAIVFLTIGYVLWTRMKGNSTIAAQPPTTTGK